MRIGIVVFVIIATIIVATAHTGLLLSIIKFFHVESGQFRKILITTFIPLSISFIVTTLLVHWYETLITRLLYIAASVWLGMFLYLLIATALCWVVFGVVKLAGFGINSQTFALPIYAVALLVSFYGFWNAANPVLKQISVKIENLPEQWRGRTIVQASDIHVGAINRAGFTQKIVRLINSAKPEAVFITGDLFDGAGTDLNHLVEPLNQIQSPRGTFFITGNHETYAGLKHTFDALAQVNLRILRDELVDLDGIQLIGLDFPLRSDKQVLDSLFAQVDRTKPVVLLYHIPASVDTMKSLGVNLQLAGHTHRGQMWPFDYITRRVYDGLDYDLHTDGSYNLFTSCGAGTWGPPLRIGNRPEVVAIRLE